MKGGNPTKPPCSRRESPRRDSKSIKDVERLSTDMVCDPWPVTKSLAKKDTILEAAQLLVRARNTELVNECGNAITLLPASDTASGFQGGSSERPLYSLRSAKVEPFKVHLWQNPAVRTWNRKSLSWDVTLGKIMVRRGLKSEPLTQLLKTLGVAKAEAKMSDLCKHFRCWRSLNIGEGWLNDYPKQLRGAVYQKWWSCNGFRFLELPPEIRELILTFAMGPIAVPFTRLWPTTRSPQTATPNLSLSYVSKQVNREAIAALSAHTMFYFHNIHQLLRVFPHTEETSRVTLRPFTQLRFVELHLSPRHLLRLFGVSFVSGVRETRYERFFGFDMGVIFDGESPLCHRIRIKIEHLFQNNMRPYHTCCQKLHNLAFWAGARVRLRNIAKVELVGHIDETQKKEWLAEHALERKGVVPEAKDLVGWQRGIWTQW